MKATMFGVLLATSSSAVSAFGPRAAFRASARSFSRTSELFANPKGESRVSDDAGAHVYILMNGVVSYHWTIILTQQSLLSIYFTLDSLL